MKYETDYRSNKYKYWLTFYGWFTYSMFLQDKMQRANLLYWLQNLQVVAALRSAMLIFLQILWWAEIWYKEWCWYIDECFN